MVSDPGHLFGHRVVRLSGLVLLLATSLPGAALAQGQKTPRRAVLIEPDDAELLQRVRGQTGDLPWQLRVVEGENQRAPDETGGLRRAQAIGERRDASVVVWMEPDDGGWMVHVADVSHGRLLTRRVAPGPQQGPLARSAGLEAAALVVRSALRSLAEGGEIGVAPAADPPPSASEKPAEPASAPSAAPRPPRPPAVEHRWGLSAGWHAVKDVDASGLRHGPRLRLEWQLNDWVVGLRGGLGLPVTLESERTDARLWRVAGMAVGGRRWRFASRWWLGLELGVGTVVVHRQTPRAEAPLRGTESAWLPRPAGTLSAQLGWRATRGLRIRLAVGADAVVSSVQFQVEQPAGATRLGKAWPLQPWLALSLAYVSDPR